ncbi:unnamed protein product [Prunus armeniaca]
MIVDPSLVISSDFFDQVSFPTPTSIVKVADIRPVRPEGKLRSQQQIIGTVSAIRRSANDQLPTSISFVKVADMSEEQWILFLEKVRELLYPAFGNRRRANHWAETEAGIILQVIDII